MPTETIYSSDFVDWLNEKLGKAEQNPAGTEIVTFCPYCEQKRDRSKHGHLYISTESPQFFCQKCNEGGLILKLIRVLNDNPAKFLKEDVIKYNTSINTNKNVKSVKSNNFILPELVNVDKKIKYLESRVYEGFDYRKIPGLIFSLKEFIQLNKIELSEGPNLIDYLDREFVGFLCNRKNMIIFRNTDPDNNFRYYKMKIVKNNFLQDFYGLKFNNITETTPKIILAEGIFDILYPATSPDFANYRKTTNVWCAVAGLSSYFHAVNSILNYYNMVKADLIILSDQGVNEYFYRKLLENPLINNLEVFWNKEEKDFGEKNISIFRKKVMKFNRRTPYGKSLSQTKENLYRNQIER